MEKGCTGTCFDCTEAPLCIAFSRSLTPGVPSAPLRVGEQTFFSSIFLPIGFKWAEDGWNAGVYHFYGADRMGYGGT